MYWVAIVINIQNITIFEPVILKGFYTSIIINCKIFTIYYKDLFHNIIMLSFKKIFISLMP